MRHPKPLHPALALAGLAVSLAASLLLLAIAAVLMQQAPTGNLAYAGLCLALAALCAICLAIHLYATRARA